MSEELSIEQAMALIEKLKAKEAAKAAQEAAAVSTAANAEDVNPSVEAIHLEQDDDDSDSDPLKDYGTDLQSELAFSHGKLV